MQIVSLILIRYVPCPNTMHQIKIVYPVLIITYTNLSVYKIQPTFGFINNDAIWLYSITNFLLFVSDSKVNNKPISKNGSKRGASEQIDPLLKKTRRASNTMDTIDLNSCDPLLSSSNLALLCSSLPMDQSSTVATNSKLSNTDIYCEITYFLDDKMLWSNRKNIVFLPHKQMCRF